MRRLVAASVLAAAVIVTATTPAAGRVAISASASASAPATGAAAALTSTTAIRRARRYARTRQGQVAFAVLGKGGRPHGLGRTTQFAAASVSKAMLMVSVMRRAGAGPLTDAERRLLPPMITRSDNDAASALYAQVGGDGLRKVARAAGMRKFVDVGHWAGARITAADQARLFLGIDNLVPVAHRRFARLLLSSIVAEQRWGIAPVARSEHMKIFFKGGWRADVTHQVALLERGGRRLALAVLTKGSPSMAYGVETIEGIAARALE
jgi:hypothetical protein